MGICLAWPSSELLNGFSGKALSGSAPIHKLWVLYLAGWIHSFHACVGAGVCNGCCVCMCEGIVSQEIHVCLVW